MKAEQGLETGYEIVAAHGGKTGAELAVAMVAECDPALAGRLAGSQIVAAYGGRTGPDLADKMARCLGATVAPFQRCRLVEAVQERETATAATQLGVSPDQLWIANGLESSQDRNGWMKTIVVFAVATVAFLGSAGSAYGDPIYANSLTDGEQPEWTATHGEWAWTAEGLTNAVWGENRIVFDVLSDVTEYEVSFSATLDAGQGWGLFFGAKLNGANRISGFGFQYDPGYGGGAYLLREWHSDAERALVQEYNLLDLQVTHDFVLAVAPDSFRAYQDGVEVLSYNDLLTPAGSLLGLRTWSDSDATFSDFSVSSTPGPAPLLLVIVGAVAAFHRRRHTPRANHRPM